MANPTTNLNITLPVPESESSRGNWGDTINAALQSLDTGIADRGVPSGGADDQVLTKDGTTNYATKWAPSVKEVNVTGSDGIEVDSGSQITTSGTIALGVNKSTMLTFLNAEDGATADQSAAEVRTLVAEASDSNVYTDADKTKLADVNTADLAITAANDANITTVAGQITPTNNIATLSTNLGNINLVGDDLSGTFSSIEDCGAIDEAVSGSSGTSNITTVAASIADINRYAAEYIISDDVPTSPTPTAGDLWYDSTNNELKFHNGTSFSAIEGDVTGVTAGTGLSGGGTTGTVSLTIDSTVTTLTGSQTLTNKTLTSPVLTTPNLGTPSTLVGTSISGTAANLTAGNVTTNANLTGHITSSGSNATTLGSFTVAQLSSALSDASISGNNTGDQTTISGNAATATALATARTIGGTSFNGTANIDITTNADLTGPITSSGNATAIANDAISGDKIHGGTISGSPTLVTPDLGTPSAMMLDFGTIT